MKYCNANSEHSYAYWKYQEGIGSTHTLIRANPILLESMWILFTSIGKLSISIAALNNHRDILNKYDRFQLIFDKFPIRLTCCKISYQVHCIRHEIKFQTLTLVFLHAKNLFGFWIVLLWAYMMSGISETRHARYIWYILFCYYHWVDTSAGGLLVPKIPSTQ